MEFDSALLDDKALQGRLDDADDCFNEDTFGNNAESGGWDVHEKTAEFFEMHEQRAGASYTGRTLELTNGNDNGFFSKREHEDSGAEFFDVTQSLSKLLDDGNGEGSASSALPLGSQHARGGFAEVPVPSKSESLPAQNILSDWRQPTATEEAQDPILLLLERSTQTPPAASISSSDNAFQVRNLEGLLPGLHVKPAVQQPANGNVPARNSPDLQGRSEWHGIAEQPVQRHQTPGPLPRHGPGPAVGQMLPGLPYLPPPGPRGMRPPVPLLTGMRPIPHGPGRLPFPFMMHGMDRFRGPVPPFPLPGQDQHRQLLPGMLFPQGPFPRPVRERNGPWPSVPQPGHTRGAARPNVERPFVLMTDREKEWIQKIQLIQLSTTDAFLDDYYYLKYCDLHANDPGAKPPLALPISPGQESEHHDPFHGRLTVFPGALGAYVSSGSVHCPRQIVDVTAPVNFKTGVSPMAERKCTLQHRGASLRAIEDAYDLLLSIDDIDHKLEGSSSTERPALLEQRKTTLNRLFSMIHVCEYRRRFDPGFLADTDKCALLLLSRQKGARLVARLLSLLPGDDQRCDIAAFVLVNAGSLMRADESGQTISILLRALCPLLEVCQLPFLFTLLQLVFHQPPVNKKPAVVALLEVSTRSSAAFLALLISSGQKQCAASPMARNLPPPAVNGWTKSCAAFSKLLEPHLEMLTQRSSSSPELVQLLNLMDLAASSKSAVRTVTVYM